MEMILQLLLIFYLSSLGFSFEYKIENDRCGKDTGCFIRKSCLASGQDTENTILVSFKNEPLKDGGCDVILQIRPFSDAKMHIMVEVNSSTAFSPEGVVLKQGDEQFRCRDGDATTGNANLVLTLFGDRRPSNPNSMFCSFILETNIPLANFGNVFKFNYEYPEILFTTDAPNSIKYTSYEATFWRASPLTCDPDQMITNDYANASHFLRMVETTRSVIECSNRELLQIERGDTSLDFPKKLECNVMQQKWEYEKINGGQRQSEFIGIVGRQKEIIKVHCTTKFCAMCEKVAPLSTCATCVQAGYPDRKDPTDCVKATCDSNRWRVPQVNAWIFSDSMECKHKQGSPNAKEVAWYMSSRNFREGQQEIEEQEVTEASCTKNERCWEINGFTNPCVAQECSKVDANFDRTKIKCDEGYDLIQVNEATKERNIFKKAVCDPLTGKYTGDGKKEIPHGSQLYCMVAPPPSTTPSTPAFRISALEVACGAGALLGIALGAGISFVAVKKIQRWKKKKEEEKRLKEFYEEADKLAEPIRKEIEAREAAAREATQRPT